MTTMRPPVDERAVASLWERQAFHPDVLRVFDLDVIFRGIPSDAGGPDYQDAIIDVACRGLVTGDVEFHVLASDWDRHGHRHDARYNGVILHVVWLNDTERTVRADGQSVPTLALAHHVSFLPGGGSGRSRDLLQPHGCLDTFRRLSTEDLRHHIVELGWRRFGDREEHFAAELEVMDPDQTLYTGLLEALGYASNRDSFRRLADVAPFGWLMSVPAPQRTTALLEAAGLGPRGFPAPPAHLPVESWRLARLRPGNHPIRRIGALANLLERLGPSPASTLTSLVASAGKPGQLRDVLVTPLADGPGIGAGRADEIAASVILPFAAALEPGLPGPRRLFARYAAPPSTRWTRVMVDLFRQSGHEFTVRGSVQHQGIHLLYTRFCRREGSHDCPLCGTAGAARSQ